jgi:GNAT superfamily N-acetyltransferase
MNHPITYIDLNPHEPSHVTALTEIWNAAFPADWMLANRLVSFNLQEVTGGRQCGQLALAAEQFIGFVVASTLPGQPQVAPSTVGWVDAIVVTPAYQRQGIGKSLLTWAESWLVKQGCQTIILGASQRPFAPGIPVTSESSETTAFFQRCGYDNPRQVWDTAANLATYQPPDTVRAIEGVVRPAQPGDEAALADFLQREFPGRWHFEFTEFLRRLGREPGPRLSDYMVLWSERGVDGFCQLTFEDSLRPIERFFPYQLPRPWGQLGPIGVSADRRGQGYGAALLDTGLRRLYNN